MRMLISLLLTVMLTTTAVAQDEPTIKLVPCVEQPAPEKSDFEKALASADGVFGKWVVGPLASVLFFDVVFWDPTTRPLGDGVGEIIGAKTRLADGKMVGGKEITDWSEEAGYSYNKRCEAHVDALSPALDEPIMRELGKLQVQVSNGDKGLVGKVAAQKVDLVALGLAPPVPTETPEPSAEEPEAPAAEPVTVTTLAPFPVQVDVVTGMTIETTIELPADTIPLVAGTVVKGADLPAAQIVGLDGPVATLRLTAGDTSADPLPNNEQIKVPIVVLWLVMGAIFFTLRMMFINVRAFWHAIEVTTGKFDDPDDPGEISHFQALASALSATVGLGNIAGVAIAVNMGGPGAIFWMVVAGTLGMSSKFVECTLGQMYRTVRADGSVSGGPMHYLDDGLREMGFGPLGKLLAVVFALMCIGGSLGGGNMFQANQSFAAVKEVVPMLADYAWVYGVLLAICVGVVIIGGIKRIGTATSIIVPVMCAMYVGAGLYILIANAAAVPAAIGTIVTSAFSPEAGYGGIVGVLIMGFQRASFSNEAGIGSASIAHSAAATKEPVREGIVALLEPFIDTIIVCTMTGLVVVVTGVYTQETGGAGVELTSRAFATVLPWFPVVLSFAVVMFAFSTMISWSYYGERTTTWLLGDWAVMPYRIVFLFCVFFGSVFELGNVLGFSDLMVLGMAFPNILGAVLLSGKVKTALDEYMRKLHAGEFQTHS